MDDEDQNINQDENQDDFGQDQDNNQDQNDYFDQNQDQQQDLGDDQNQQQDINDGLNQNQQQDMNDQQDFGQQDQHQNPNYEDQNQQNFDQNDDNQQNQDFAQGEENGQQFIGNYNDLVQMHLEEISQAYDYMVGKDMDGNLGLEASCNLVDEIGNIIQRDCSGAKNELRQESGIYQDQEAITFQQFMEFFQPWAAKQRDELQGHQHSQEDFQPPKNPIDSQEISRQLPEFRQTEEEEILTKGRNIYKEHNQMIIERFLRHHGSQMQSYFNEYSKDINLPKVIASEVPLVLRVGFYIDNITFHATKEDPEEFLNKEESYKIMMAHLDKFIELNGFQAYPDVNTFKMNYTQFLQFLEYFLDNEPNIFLKQGTINIFFQQTKYDNENENKLIKELNQNIRNYVEMLEDAQTEKDRQVIQNMLSALYDQLNKLKNNESQTHKTQISRRKAPLTKNEQRKKNLQEVFVFYCKQQYSHSGSHGLTIERVIHESSILNMGKFMLFAKQFNIVNFCLKLQKKQLPVLFKKNASNYKDMSFDEFQQFIEKIALIMYEDKDEDFPNDLDKIEAFYRYIGIDNQEVYRGHMQVLNPPFNIQEKPDFRLLPKDQGRKLVLKELQPSQKEDLERKKREREFLLKKYQAMTPQPLPQNSKMNTSQTTAHLPKNTPQHYIYDSYQSKKEKLVSKQKPEQNQKITWEKLDNLEYNDISNIKQNKFKPTDLFDENENHEDKQYLGQFSLQDDKIKKQQEMQINRQSQEVYGQYKQGMRPTEKLMIQQDPTYSLKKNQLHNLHRHHASQDNFEMNPVYMNPGSISPQPQQQFNSHYQNLNNYSTKNQYSQIGQNYMQRANQLDIAERQKEKKMMQQIQNSNQNNQNYYRR